MPDHHEIGNPQDGESLGPGGPGGPAVVTIRGDLSGERLDKALAASLPGLSRSRVQALLESGCVRTDGRPVADASLRVRAGDAFEVTVPEAEPAEPVAQDIPLTVLHEDGDVVVLDKPAGLVVHPAAGNADGTLVNALLAHCGDSLSGIGGVRRPGIVHRLDKDTSGLMVVAKNDGAHHALTAQFADRSLSRTYLALVWGVPSPREGRIEGNIGRSGTDRKKMAVVPSGGKHAATRYRVRSSYGLSAALVECRLETGRTHQIRVHMTHIGHPLVGDPVYGRGRTARPTGSRAAALPEPARRALVEFPRQALHAAAIEFVHPTTGKPMRFEAALPADMAALIASLDGP